MGNVLRNIVLILFPGIVLTMGLSAQIHVSGIVRDSMSGELLIGANVFDPAQMTGTSTDNNGYFNVVLNPESDSLLITYVGYASIGIPIVQTGDTILNVKLIPGSDIEEVQVRGYRKVQFNQSRLSNKELMYIPAIGAEPDVLKTLQLLPGIQSQNEGSSNLLIRGGGPGQNLFLIDNVPLYYVNHLGGFISVFNPEVLNDVRVIKGGFPAKYGGKLSSVIDITMREGDKSGFRGSAGIGLIGANLTLEGPLSEKASYLISARKTFTELLLGTASLLTDDDYIVTYGFYDLNGKITWHPDYRNSVQASIYIGDDQFIFRVYDGDEQMRMKNKWGNVLCSVAWKRILSPKSQFNNTLSFTRYRLKDLRHYKYSYTDGSSDNFHSNYLSSVQDITLKSDWRYRIIHGWSLDLGLQSSYLFFVPNQYWDNQGDPESDPEKISALESAIYGENHFSIARVIDLNLGIRGTHYMTSDYTDYCLEPRFDFSLNLSESHTLNATYMRGSQYSHMVFSSGHFFNNEVWVPTREGMRPARVDQYSLGWRGSFMKGMFVAEVDVYRKKMSELLAFKEGYANLKGDALWESKLEKGGKGESGGIELFLRKQRGLWTGFLSYAYSRTTRQFDQINQGIEYVFEYDRPHCLSFDLHRTIGERWEFNALWVYQSGLPYTPSIARSYIPYTGDPEVVYDYEALIYGERNSERMRAYHRLDVALHYKTKTEKGRNATWTFSIYNLYCRQNPYFYYYNTEARLDFGNYGSEARNGFLNLYQFSYFPIIPSVSYKVDF
jgi:CarboxypepD_reg-like domain/TonB-dependent Receptor Plug Domain